MPSTRQAGVIDFARRPNEVFQRLAWIALPAVMLMAVCGELASLGTVLFTNRGQHATQAHIMAVPIFVFLAFVLYLTAVMIRTARRAFADRFLPLVTLDPTGVTLHRTNPVQIPWQEIAGVNLERGFKGSTTLLRLEVRDPTVVEGGQNGRIIDLRSLERKPTELLSTIQSYPAFQPNSDR